MKWFEILEEVKNAKGKEKIEVLKKYQDNELLPEILDFLYNPRIVTGISKKKMENTFTDNDFYDDNSNDRVKRVMDYLKEHNTGKMSAVSFVNCAINDTDDMMEKEYLESLVIKDMPIGISAASVNKVWKKLIPVFKLQKGQLFEGELTGEQAVSLKLDGNSATVFNLQDKTFMLSRSGAIMEGFDHILKYYRENLPKGFVYQGELIAKNYRKMGHGELFRYSNGITNSKKDAEKENLQHVIFDIIDETSFEKGISYVPYIARLDQLKDYNIKTYDPYGDSFNEVEIVPFYVFTDDIDLIMSLAKETIDNNLEGLMICKASSIYKKGKQKWLQKIKEFQTLDLEVIDLKEHVRGGKVGSLVVNYHGGEVNVGGIKDEDRIKWWNEPNSIIGKIVEVKFFRETTDKFGNKSLRFPTFVRVRDDKFEESYE